MSSTSEKANRFVLVSLYYGLGALASVAVALLLCAAFLFMSPSRITDYFLVSVIVTVFAVAVVFVYMTRRTIVFGQVTGERLTLRPLLSRRAVAIDASSCDRLVMTRRNVSHLEGPRFVEYSVFRKTVGFFLRNIWLINVGPENILTSRRGLIDLVVIFVVQGESHRQILIPAPTILNRRGYRRLLSFLEESGLPWKADRKLHRDFVEFNQL